MLTEVDIQNIHSLKEKGYAKAKVAKTLGLSRGSVSKYWGGDGSRVSLADLKRRFDECFAWVTCQRCGVMAWAPKFLPSWECPNCRVRRQWQQSHFHDSAKKTN